MILWSSLEHLHNLREVIRCFDSAGASLRKAFMMHKMNYLGHVIDEQDLPERVKAIIEALSSCSVLELRSFLELLNYYCKFLPNLSSLLNSLYHLIEENVKWLYQPGSSIPESQESTIIISAAGSF